LTASRIAIVKLDGEWAGNGPTKELVDKIFGIETNQKKKNYKTIKKTKLFLKKKLKLKLNQFQTPKPIPKKKKPQNQN
jgi:hypothetical protein